MIAHLTEAEFAERLGISPAKAGEFRKRYQWPHLRFGRFDIRYTEAQILQIEAIHTVKPEALNLPAALPGQTKRSARRSA